MQELGEDAPRDPLTGRIIGCCIAVHRALGPGLLESVYAACLAIELEAQGIRFRREVTLPVVYRNITIDMEYRLDFVVEERVILELKSIDKIHPIHKAQTLTYMKLSGCPVGLIVNFNVPILKEGIFRLDVRDPFQN